MSRILCLLVLVGLSCKPLPPLADVPPLENCTRKAKMHLTCPGLILSDGVINCTQCWATDYYSNNEKDVVGSCYDYDYNVYCVSAENGCGDGRCRVSPVHFNQDRKQDAGVSTDSGNINR